MIYFHIDRKLELYNLREDIGEENNLAKENPEKLNELAKVLTDHLKECSAQMPVDKTTGKEVEYPVEILDKE